MATQWELFYFVSHDGRRSGLARRSGAADLFVGKGHEYSTMMTWLRSLDRNEMAYWLGLVMLFIGLAISVSAATALAVVGAAMAAESVITSYLAAWIGARK